MSWMWGCNAQWVGQHRLPKSFHDQTLMFAIWFSCSEVIKSSGSTAQTQTGHLPAQVLTFLLIQIMTQDALKFYILAD